MAAIPKWLRTLITDRAKGLCEYCQTPQAIVIEMEIDHIVPESAGGETTMENLCLACISCNGFKTDAQTGIDPETRKVAALFNPRSQIWIEHFQWIDDGVRLLGLTPTGRATVEKLKINREVVVRARERWVKANWHPPQS